MEFTGERMVPEHNEGGVTYLEHLARYHFVSQFVKNKNVLDIACGSGYGSKIIADAGAFKVFGVDISEEAILYCKEKYGDENIKFFQGSVSQIPQDDNSVDIVVSFETIEHVDKETQHVFLKEVKRVLKKSGVFIVSTPNSLVYPKGNEFHVHEMNPGEFRHAIDENFKKSRIYYQDDVACSYIMSESVVKADAFISSSELINLEKSEYMIAVCSDSDFDFDSVLNSVGLSAWKPYKALESNVDIDHKKRLELMDQEIIFMKSSKFWKLREWNNKIKFALLHPISFCIKYINNKNA